MTVPRNWKIYFVPILLLSFFVITGCRGCRDSSDDFPTAATTVSGNKLAVSSTIPANRETGVALNSRIAINFTEWMNPWTFAGGAISVTGPSGFSMTGTASSSGLVGIFRPDAIFAANSTYTIVVNTTVKDLGGNGMAENYTFYFTTGTVVDNISPAVVSTNPAAFAKNIPVNQRLVIPFSEPIDPLTINSNTLFLTETGATANNVLGSVHADIRPAIGNLIAGTVTLVGQTAIFIPTQALDNNTIYTATIVGGANGVTDLAGNPLANPSYKWSFTTIQADLVQPTVRSTDPAGGETGVAINKNVAVTFSEILDPLTVKATTFSVTGPGATAVAGAVTYDDLVGKFSPHSDFSPNTTFTARIIGGLEGVKDLAGNELASDYTFSFTSGAVADNVAPTVVSTNPANGATGVAGDKIIFMTFSEGMDSSTIISNNFKVEGPGGVAISGTLTFAGRMASFTPEIRLADSTTYSITIATGSKDLAGNALAAIYTWSFTTGVTGLGSVPVVSNNDPARGAIDVAINKKIAVTFSMAMNPSTINTTTFTLAKLGAAPVSGTVTMSGLTATFVPAGQLENNATYTAKITTGARNLADKAMAANYSWIFTTGATADTTPPMVTGTSNANGSTDVAINTKFGVTFSEGMDPTTISNVTFLVTGPGGIVATGAVAYSGLTANFSPSSPLAPNAVYTATIATGTKDLAGNALAAKYTWSFTTAAISDTTAPKVSSTDPSSGAISVSTNKKIAITFSEGMDATTINNTTFTMTGPGGIVATGTVSYSGLIANFAPSSLLADATTYTATINTGAKDLAGNALATNYTWSFTTGGAPDTTPPTVLSVDPVSSTIDVVISKKLGLAFSETMDASTINNTTFTLTGPSGIVATGTVSYSGVTANFIPSSLLALNSIYTASLNTGAKDLAGNALATKFTWTFTTATRPKVSSTDPTSGATDVAISKQISTVFSHAMDSATITGTTFTLTGPGLAPVAGTVAYDRTAATFSPTGTLPAGTTFTATITTGAKDQAGNALAAPYTWTFTTAVPPTVTSQDPASGATNIALNKQIAVGFSRAMDQSTISLITMTLKDKDGVPVSGVVSKTSTTAKFSPIGALDPNATYTATIGTGVKDAGGIPLAANFTWTFSTGLAGDSSAPTVTSVYPASNTLNVGVYEVMTASFSEGMDPDTLTNSTFKLALLDGTPVVGAVTYDVMTMTALFTPSLQLPEVTTFTATISTGATDLAGNHLATPIIWVFSTGQTPPVMGRGASFVMLATTKIDGTTGSNITGDVGLSPNDLTSMSLSQVEIDGNISTGLDQAVVDAQADLLTAYNFAAGKSTKVVQVAATDLGGKTFYPGLYKAPTSFDITLGDLTLDAQGNPNAVFVFQMESTLTVATGKHVVLAGGAKAKNVYWQCGSSATLNTTAIFKGNILANVSIIVDTGSDVEGRLMAGVGTAGAGAVTFNSAKIYLPAE